MAQLIVRNIPEDLKSGLRARAKRHGRSMEAEIRVILQAAASAEPANSEPLGTWIARRFAGLGLVEEITELRGQTVIPPEFEA